MAMFNSFLFVCQAGYKPRFLLQHFPGADSSSMGIRSDHDISLSIWKWWAHSHGKSRCFIGKPSISIRAISHGYVSHNQRLFLQACDYDLPRSRSRFCSMIYHDLPHWDMKQHDWHLKFFGHGQVSAEHWSDLHHYLSFGRPIWAVPKTIYIYPLCPGLLGWYLVEDGL